MLIWYLIIKAFIKANFEEKEFPNIKSGSYSIKFKDCDEVYIRHTKRNVEGTTLEI